MTWEAKILIALSLLILLSVLPMYDLIHRPNSPHPSMRLGKVEIERGELLGCIADKLQTALLIDSGIRFIWACRILGVEHDFPAGTFTIPFGLSNRELVERMLFRGTNTANVTISEGFTAARIAGELQDRLGVDSAAFMAAVYDSNLIRRQGVEAGSLEGYLFPDTYNFYLGADPLELISKMTAQFHRVFNDTLKSRAFQLGFSVNQIITLASIIEGEIIFSSEARLVSAVYHNRLNRGMRLQADPTIQYIIEDSPRRLKYSDLRIKSPYNTYLNKGLPPGPIGNPGKRAIIAALYPAEVPYLYFVAKGDGYHNFNVTVEEHYADKRKFNQYRRKIARQKRLARQ